VISAHRKGARIGVVGLGYVGLPLAVAFGRNLDTVRFDINAARVPAPPSGVGSPPGSSPAPPESAPAFSELPRPPLEARTRAPNAGRTLAHVVHAAGEDDAGFFRLDVLRAAQHGLDAGAAQAVHGERRYLNRHAGFQGDLVKTGLPSVGRGAGAFGRDDQDKFVALTELVDHLLDHVAPL